MRRGGGVGEAGEAQAGFGEGVEAVGGERGPHPGQGAAHQAQVQGTDDVLVMLGDLTEGAVVQAQPVAVLAGLGPGGEAELVQDGGEPRDRFGAG